MYNGLRMATMLRPSQNRLKESQAIQLCCTTNRHSRAASSRIVCVNLGSEEERRINKINLMEAAIGISILRHCSELKNSTGSPIPTQTLNSYGNVFLNHCHRHEWLPSYVTPSHWWGVRTPSHWRLGVNDYLKCFFLPRHKWLPLTWMTHQYAYSVEPKPCLGVTLHAVNYTAGLLKTVTDLLIPWKLRFTLLLIQWTEVSAPGVLTLSIQPPKQWHGYGGSFPPGVASP